MRKYIATIVFFLIGFVLVLPSLVKADVAGHDNVTFSEDATLYLSGLGKNFTVSSGGEVNQLTVATSSITIKLLAGSKITITSADKYILANDLVETNCGSSQSSITISTSTTSGFNSVHTITIAPSYYCPTGGSAGGQSVSVTEEEVEEQAEVEAEKQAEPTPAEEVVEEEKPISEMSVEELKAKIAEIIEKIIEFKAALVAQLQEEVVISGVPAGFSFTKNLEQRMADTDVRYLQIVLNSDPATRLAETGVGSPGRETNYFGSLTKAAVIKFQEKYSTGVLAPWGLSSGTGYVGKTTRAKLNELLAD